MQDFFGTKDDFLERTDNLAARLGISLRSLAPKMGLSVASLFGYRNGAIPISTKAWRKLEQAESNVSNGDGTIMREGEKSYGSELTLENRVERLENLLESIAETIMKSLTTKETKP